MNNPCLFKASSGGSYFCGSNADFSAYQGWFVFFEKEWELFKVLDRISGDFDVNISDRSLFLTSKSGNPISFFCDVDFRFVHDFDDRGRIYEVYSRDEVLVVKYSKFLDNSLSEKVFSYYLVIRGLDSFVLEESWIKKFYPFDAERKALSEFFVFRLLNGVSKKLVLGFGSTEEEAFVCSLAVPQESYIPLFLNDKKQTKLIDEDKEALFVVSSAFSSLVKRLGFDFFIFAGYPWFYQVWTRDECISLIGLFYQGRFDVAKNIILRNLNSFTNEGFLPNRFPVSVLPSADATGWFFQRILLFLKFTKNNGFTDRELVIVEKKLDAYLAFCKSKSYKGLIYNGPKETWMDTEGIDLSDVRAGARVEIQALFLSALELKAYLRKLAGDNAGFLKFKSKIKKRKTLIRSALIKNNILHDGFNEGVLDETIRPNVFLAFYAFPSLAMKRQWLATFNHVLNSCWLDWGGLSSISKNHHLFKEYYSGMDNASYHRGDSWFFINNIVALSLFKFDSDLFSDKINLIKKASVDELLNKGFLGHCAEISSARALESKGCLNQAWSSATLLELLFVSKD